MVTVCQLWTYKLSLLNADTNTDLVDGSKSSRTKNLDPLQLRLFQDAQLSLVWCRSTGSQGLNQLRKHTFRHINPSITEASSEAANYSTKRAFLADAVLTALPQWWGLHNTHMLTV